MNSETDQEKETVEQLRQVSERLLVATKAAGIGIWDWDVVNDHLLWDDKMYELFGIAREDFSGAYDAWANSLAPQDFESATAEVRAALRGEREFAAEFRIVWPDNSIHFLKASAETFWDDVGRPVRMVGVSYDITKRKLAEEQLALLQTITIDVAAADDLPSALEVVLRRVCEKTGWALGQAWVPRQDGGSLDCCPAWFATAPGLEEFRHYSREIIISSGQGLPGRVIEQKQPVWIGDVTQDANFPRAEAARKSGLKAALGVPILAGDEVIAVLEFFLVERREEDERLVNVITAVAAQIGLVFGHKSAEQRLRWSEERYRKIVEAAPEAIVVADVATGKFVDFNPQALALFKLAPDEILQVGPSEMSPPYQPNRQPSSEEAKRYIQAALSGETPVFEWIHRDREGNDIQCEIRLLKLPDQSRLLVRGTITDITERKLAEAQLLSSQQQLRALSERLRRAKEDEGIRIARELHDELGSTLTSLKWSLLGLQEPSSKHANPDRVDKIAEMVGLVDGTINTVRRISSELRPAILDDLGLVAAVEWHLQQFQQNTGIKCDCDALVDQVDLDPEQATVVFRIVQEAMTNALRHANATKVNVIIEEEDNELVVEIRDNGRGITEGEKLGTRTLGLLGMRERAHSIGGKVDIAGVASKGTKVTVRLPLQKKAAAGQRL